MTDLDPDALDGEVERRLRAPDPRDLDWVRERLRLETAHRAEAGGCGDTLYALCFLLYLLGEAADARRIFEAKGANMDAGAMIDRGLLTVRRSLPELQQALHATRDAELLEELASAFDAPDELENLEENLRSYFGL